MARPTDEKKDRIVKLRVSEDLYSELMAKGPNLSETIRKILKGDSFVPQNAPMNETIPEWKEDLDAMLGLGGMDFNDFMEVVYGWVCDGTIDFTGGVHIMEASWVTDMRETCHDLCIPVEKAAESACKALRKGLI